MATEITYDAAILLESADAEQSSCNGDSGGPFIGNGASKVVSGITSMAQLLVMMEKVITRRFILISIG